jgi:hypothetical protein
MVLENHHNGIDLIRLMVLNGANDFQYLTKVELSKERGGNMIKKFYDKISLYEGPLFHEEPEGFFIFFIYLLLLFFHLSLGVGKLLILKRDNSLEIVDGLFIAGVLKEAIYTDNGKEFFIEYNEKGNEISRKRTFGDFYKFYYLFTNKIF